MWRRRTEPEIARVTEEGRRRRRRWWPPLLTGVLFGVVIMVLWSFGYRGGRVSSGVVVLGSQSRLLEPRNLLVFGLSVAIMSTIAYVKQRRTGGWLISEEPSVICASCQAIAATGASPACDCGGRWEPIDHWQWDPSAVAPERSGASQGGA